MFQKIEILLLKILKLMYWFDEDFLFGCIFINKVDLTASKFEAGSAALN